MAAMPNAHAAVILMRLVLAWANPLLNRILRQLLRPAAPTALFGAVTDLTRCKADLIAENALLRYQLTLLKRQSKRPKLKPADRLSLLLLARVTRTWRQALLIVQPATLLRWHRQGYRLFWKWKSRKQNRQPRISADTIALIRRMWVENPLWGAERVRGELLKLGIEVAKRTIHRYAARKPWPREPGQSWSTFLKTHAKDVWACDFVPVIDLLFRQLFVFFIVELESRRVVHFGVTRHPNQFWVARQLREATSDRQGPRFILRDNDSKYGSAFDVVARVRGIDVLRTPIKAPRANAIVERYIGSVRRECLDHLLIYSERQLYRVIQAYVDYFNRSRPHQGIGQTVPCGPPTDHIGPGMGKIISFPVLNGLHHEYRRAA
jgi:transposase InsO family protein